jgi:hypothetical protein
LPEGRRNGQVSASLTVGHRPESDPNRSPGTIVY